MAFPLRNSRAQSLQHRSSYSASRYLSELAPSVRASLTAEQHQEFERILNLAIPKPSPKLIDLRFEIDLLFNRFFIVLLVGEDQRRRARRYSVSAATRLGNAVAAVMLLVGFNLTVTATLFLIAYLIKSAVGIDLFPGHMRNIFD